MNARYTESVDLIFDEHCGCEDDCYEVNPDILLLVNMFHTCHPPVMHRKNPILHSPEDDPKNYYPAAPHPLAKEYQAMSTLRFFNTHYVRSKKIKLAAEARCELCGTEEGLDDLEIHTFIDEDFAEKMPLPDIEQFLLVLCSQCHYDLHRFSAPVEEQEILVQRRREEIRQKIRKLLAYVPRQYSPPETDLEEAYKDACSSRFRFGT